MRKKIKVLSENVDYISMKIKKLKTGDFLFREGHISTELYYIEKGKVAILCKDDSDHSVPVTTIEAGNFVGEFAFFDDLERTASVMALESVTLKVLDEELFEKFTPNAKFVISKLIQKMKKMNKEITENDNKNTTKKAA